MIKVTYDIMNKIFYEISDKYGWENVPYEYSDTAFSDKTTRIEICMWRYNVIFISMLFIKYNIIIDIDKDSIIFLDAKDDIYKKVEK